MPRGFSRSLRSSGSRPNRTWSGISNAAYVNVPAASKVLLGSFTATNPGIDETILRTVGLMAVRSDQSAAAEEQLGAFGMYVVSDRAIAIGLSAIPGPVTNIDDDGWFMYQPVAQAFLFLTAAGFESDNARHYPFDSKAKRVVPSGMGIAVMVENSHATHAFDIAFTIRILSQVRGTH